ncbi:MAG: RNA polymerase subunit sigma [Rhodospirillaceae bacterium]|nr:RNA polymerase subunit sigma [Rhodospirillaceae bacterium]|tara:strand:+ start:196 stop:714 length:519 start_codon:yes stop_codon:yes gene_type:complete
MHESLLLRAYHEYEWELLRFLGRRLGSRSLAADIAHDLYVKLLRTEGEPPVRDRRAYLFTMAANLATDHMRVEKRRGEILAETDGAAWRQSEDLTPERHAVARAELAEMDAVLAALPARCRRVFFLARFDGLSQPQIAAELGIGITTVYKDLKAALAALTEARRRFQGGPND